MTFLTISPTGFNLATGVSSTSSPTTWAPWCSGSSSWSWTVRWERKGNRSFLKMTATPIWENLFSLQYRDEIGWSGCYEYFIILQSQTPSDNLWLFMTWWDSPESVSLWSTIILLCFVIIFLLRAILIINVFSIHSVILNHFFPLQMVLPRIEVFFILWGAK